MLDPSDIVISSLDIDEHEKFKQKAENIIKSLLVDDAAIELSKESFGYLEE